MWSLNSFRTYLDTTLKQTDAWKTKIYPSIKRNVIAVMNASFDDLLLEPNCFELYGADFMITDKLDSVMLEVNSSPDMAASTPVTKQICPECLVDVIKGIINYYAN